MQNEMGNINQYCLPQQNPALHRWIANFLSRCLIEPIATVSLK